MSNSIKKEPTSPIRLEKLFAPKRDLNFAYNKNNQMRAKSTKPNLFAERSKRNLENVSEELEVKRIKFPKIRSKKKTEKPSYIQTYGVLSEGTTVKEIPKKVRRRIKDEIEEESVENENEIQLEVENSQEGVLGDYSEAQMIRVLQGVSLDGSEDSKSFQDYKDEMNPVKIKKYCQQEFEPPMDFEDDNPMIPKREDPLPLFDNAHNPLMFFQFPDSLPGKVKEEVQEMEPEPYSKLNVKQKSPTRCALPDLNE